MPASFQSTATPRSRRGFSVTELLVVIAIIAILVTLLLVALGGATDRAKAVKTLALMTEFTKACDTFQLEHDRYPGPVPEDAIPAGAPVTSMELALLDLMGGLRVFHPTLARDTDGSYANYAGDEIALGNNWMIKVEFDDIGAGPVINGKPYVPYFTPKESDLVAVDGQVGAVTVTANRGTGNEVDVELPDLVDAWGQPIAYIKKSRDSGNLVGAPGTLAQFYWTGTLPYVQSTELGELGIDQSDSILNVGQPDIHQVLAQLIRSPAFGARDTPLAGTARGAIALLSAGPDGIYFSQYDGPGDAAAAITDIISAPEFNDPKVVEEYDDIRVFTGS